MPTVRQTFPRTRRLSGKETFEAVYETRVRQTRGPLTVYARPNDLPHSRIGLSVPRRVGTAPRRNRIKRMIRESFRLMQQDWPKGYDLIVVVRPHEPLPLADYRSILGDLFRKLQGVWEKKAN